MNCKICKGEGWVCENHPDRPWNEGEPGCCGGAGQPCECNTSEPPWAHKDPKLKNAEDRLRRALEVVEHQSNQDALWNPTSPREHIFVAAIRHLHAVIEGEDIVAARAKKQYWDITEEI